MLGRTNLLLKSSVAYVLATILGQGFSFLGIIIFTRIMTQEEYGNYSTYYAYVSIFAVLIGANLYYALNNAYIDKPDCIHEFRKSVLALSVMIATGVSALLTLVGCVITHKFSAFISIMSALHSYGFFVVNYRIYSANMENDYKKKQWLLILPNMMQLLIAIVFIFVLPINGYYARVLGSVIGVLLVAVIPFIEMIHCKGNVINREYWGYALKIAMPSILMSLSYMVMQQSDKVMITEFCGAEETAIYAVIYYLGYAVMAVDQALAPVRQSWIYQRLHEGDVKKAKMLQKWYLSLIAFIGAVLYMIGPELIKLVAPRSYWRFSLVVPFVCGACVMAMYRFYTEILLFYKKNMSLSISVFFAAALNVLLNMIWIPKAGASAAAYTTVAASIVLFFLTAWLSEKEMKGTYSGKIFVAFLAFLICISGIYYLTYMSALWRYVSYSCVIVGMVVALLRQGSELS